MLIELSARSHWSGVEKPWPRQACVSREKRRAFVMPAAAGSHRTCLSSPSSSRAGFEGGGTQFVDIEGAPIFRPAVGAALLFSGKNRHRGVATTKGVRYILAGLIDVCERSRLRSRSRSRSRSR